MDGAATATVAAGRVIVLMACQNPMAIRIDLNSSSAGSASRADKTTK
jgi:hypothetical protein